MREFILRSRRMGKTLAIEKALSDHIKRNPDLVIAHFKNGEMIIEKPVKQVKRKLIEAKPCH